MIPIWKDTIYTAQTSGITFVVVNNNNVLYKGRASAFPNGKIEIPMNTICSKFLDSSLPDFTNISNSAVTMSNACKKFELSEDTGEAVQLLSEYSFFNDWSYEGTDVTNKVLSNPINGHMDSRMKLFYTVLKNNAGNICYTNEN